MATRDIHGAESGHLQTEGLVIGGSTISTAAPRTGARSFIHTGNNDKVQIASFTATAGVDYFLRTYMRFDTWPDSTVAIARIIPSTNVGCSIKVTSGGLFQLFNDSSGAQVGSSSFAASLSTYYRLELRLRVDTGSIDQIEGFFEGAQLGIATGLALTDTLTGWSWSCGFIDDPGASKTAYSDDIAFYDSTGSSNNSWPGDGRVYALWPISDNNRGSWTGGVGGTTNLFDAVNNIPPVGVATASQTDTSNIESAANSATDNCDLNMTTYTTAGVGPNDTILAVQAWCDHAEDIATGTKSGALIIVSNPTQASETTFTFGDDSGAAGTFPANWKTHKSTIIELPSVTLGTSPVLRIGKRTSTTRVVDSDQMGIYVHVRPSSLPVVPAHKPSQPAFNTLLRM